MNRKTLGTVLTAGAKPALVPKLRFPEFRAAEGWALRRLGSVGQLTRGLTYSAEDVAPAGLLVLRSTNIQDGSLVLDQDLVFVGKPCPEALRLQTGDIVICMSNGSKALVGKSGEYSGEYEGDITVGAFCSFFRPEVPFAKIAFHLNSYQRYIADLIAGGNINNLNNSVLEEFSFPVPSLLAEQQKIVDCLASLDELIAAQARKVDALKTYKNGLMQQLFPREGETQPSLRFPEFQNAGEWEEQSVGDIGQVVTGSTPSTAKTEFYGGGIPFVSPADISDLRFVDQTKTTLTPEGFAETRSVRAGSVLFVCIGSTIGKVAQSVHDCATNQQINSVVPSSKHSDDFVYFALSYASDRISLLAGRQAVPIINKSLFSSVRLLVPKLPEQQRIAACLSSLDDMIAAETKKLEAVKSHKKGLMQQLFPCLEEEK